MIKELINALRRIYPNHLITISVDFNQHVDCFTKEPCALEIEWTLYYDGNIKNFLSFEELRTFVESLTRPHCENIILEAEKIVNAKGGSDGSR